MGPQNWTLCNILATPQNKKAFKNLLLCGVPGRLRSFAKLDKEATAAEKRKTGKKRASKRDSAFFHSQIRRIRLFFCFPPPPDLYLPLTGTQCPPPPPLLLVAIWTAAVVYRSSWLVQLLALLFICGAADRSGRGKRCSCCCCCWGGDHFSVSHVQFFGV